MLAVTFGILIASFAVADDSMMGQPPAMSGSGSMSGSNSMGDASSMTQPNTMGNTMTADPAVGNRLRYAPSDGHKVIFSTLAAAQALAEKGPAVLFFAADWCPYCQADLKDINDHGDMLGNDVTIIVVDYDKSSELKMKYGVTAQDTFVQIDTHGRKLAIWNGGGVAGINEHVDRM